MERKYKKRGEEEGNSERKKGITRGEETRGGIMTAEKRRGKEEKNKKRARDGRKQGGETGNRTRR